MRIGFSWGHGGHNIGTKAGGILEKNETRRLGEELIHALPHDRVTPEILRVGDEYVSNRDRGARSAGCKFVMDIHINAHEDHHCAGMEVYILPGERIWERQVARSILAAAPEPLRPGRLRIADPIGWTSRAYAVLSPHVCPVVLVEVCYASNAGDLDVLLSGWGRLAIVSSLRAGVATMLRSQEEE